MMSILLADTLSTLAALILCIFVFVLPGAGFARWVALPGFERAGIGGRLALSLVASIACLPVLLDLAGRFGSGVMVALTLVLALAGVVALLPLRFALTRSHLAGFGFLALWAIFGALMLADWPSEGGLRRSVLMADPRQACHGDMGHRGCRHAALQPHFFHARRSRGLLLFLLRTHRSRREN